MEVMERETKRMPILYTGPSFWNSFGLGSDFSQCPLWVSHYYTKSPLVPTGWDGWTFWQHTDKYECAGIVGRVDGNLFNGEVEDLAPMRTTNPGPGRDYGSFPKAIRRVKRAFKTSPKIRDKPIRKMGGFKH